MTARWRCTASTRARLDAGAELRARSPPNCSSSSRGAELIIHNAAFDIGFLDAEFARLPGAPVTVAALCTVLDTLALARQLHPGQRNSLDALCKRYSVDNSGRAAARRAARCAHSGGASTWP